MNKSYSFGSRSGSSVFDFTIEQPGMYEFSAVYAEGQKGSQAVFAVGQGFMKGIFGAIAGSLAIFFGTMALGVTIGLITFFKRRKSSDILQRNASQR